MAYKKIEGGNVWKPEDEGDQIEGVLKAIRPSKMYEDNFVYDIQTKEGLKSVFGSAVLNARMEQVEAGCKIKIVFTGLQQSKIKGRNPTKLFDVFVDN